jgi:hypothetical protein
MTQKIFNKTMLRIKGHVKDNWGSPVLVMSMLSIGLSPLANDIAIFAYYALVVGVILELFCFLKYRQRDEGGSL